MYHDLAGAAAFAELQQYALFDLREAAFKPFQWMNDQARRQA